MNANPTGKDFALDQRYLDSYASLAYDIASQYVEAPDQLRITVEIVGKAIKVAFPGQHLKIDHGKLIGGKGAHYRALKRLLEEYGQHFGHTVWLDIIEPGGRPHNGDPYADDLEWNEAKDELFRSQLQSICERVLGYPVGVRLYGAWDITHFIIESGELDPELLAAFQLLWVATGRNHGRQMKVSTGAPQEIRQAV